MRISRYVHVRKLYRVMLPEGKYLSEYPSIVGLYTRGEAAKKARQFGGVAELDPYTIERETVVVDRIAQRERN